MRKLTLCVIVIGCFFVSCASGPQRTIPSISRDTVPGPNESEVIVQYASSFLQGKAKGMLNVLLDGEMVAQVMADTTERIIVRNGPHTISVRQVGKKDINISAKFDVYSERITYSVVRILMALTLAKQSQTPLRDQTSGIAGAIAAVGDDLMENLPENAIIAVLSVAAREQNDASLVISELEYMLVNSKRFKIVDRKSMDEVRVEKDFQMSGEVSDASAVSIGQSLGANIVIIGSITESGATKSLSLKALDVETSEIVAMGREYY